MALSDPKRILVCVASVKKVTHSSKLSEGEKKEERKCEKVRK
jgi:hypothetical protein